MVEHSGIPQGQYGSYPMNHGPQYHPAGYFFPPYNSGYLGPQPGALGMPNQGPNPQDNVFSAHYSAVAPTAPAPSTRCSSILSESIPSVPTAALSTTCSTTMVSGLTATAIVRKTYQIKFDRLLTCVIAYCYSQVVARRFQPTLNWQRPRPPTCHPGHRHRSNPLYVKLIRSNSIIYLPVLLLQPSDVKEVSADPELADSSPANNSLESSPTIGRLSNNSRKALNDGFDELDTVLKRISNATGLPPIQIVERWDATKTRVVNSWNIYQGYFEERREQELSRLPPEERPHVSVYTMFILLLKV